MRKSTKILLLVATVWPIVWMVLFFVFVFGLGFSAAWTATDTGVKDFPDPSRAFPLVFIPVMIVHGLTVLWIWGLIAIYIVLVVRNQRLQGDSKALWVVVVILASTIGQIIYWALQVWPEQPAATGPPQEG